jgi:hypothetical protein
MEDFLDDDDDDDDDNVHPLRSSWVLSASHTTSSFTMQRMSLGVGLLLGIFMQCSMLGICAYFISKSGTSSNNSRTEQTLDATTGNAVTLPIMMDDRLFAELLTVLMSGLGILALWILQSLVAAVTQSIIQDDYDDPRCATSGTYPYYHDDTLPETVMELVTKPAACGGLLGVCGASLVMSEAVWGQARLCRPDLDLSHSLVGHKMLSVWSIALLMVSGVVMVRILYAQRSSAAVGPPILSGIDSTQSGDASSLSQPLLVPSDEPHQHHDHCEEPMSTHTEPEWSQESAPDSTTFTRSSSHWHLQWSSLLLGSLIGWLVQCASLSANVWIANFQSLQQLHSPQEQHLPNSALVKPDAFLRQLVLHTSLAWSLASSGMGIGLFLLVRSLLKQLPIVLQDDLSTASKTTDAGSSVSLDHKHIFLRVDCYMAAGAVFVLNLAWTITELGMEKSHWYQSLWIVLVTIVWCQFVLFCCGGSRHDDGGQVSRRRSLSVDGSMVV